MSRRIRNRKATRNPGTDAFHNALRRAQIPERYWGADSNSIRVDHIRRWVEHNVEMAPEWLADGKGFYVNGPLNAGKSSIAAILAKEAVWRCESVLWMSVRDVPAARFRETDRSAEIDDHLHVCDLLVLDDLGSERFKRTGPAASALEETVRIVYDRGRSIIVTSNLSWRQLGLEYGTLNEPLVSVLRRMVTPVEVKNDQWPMEEMA